MATYPTVVVFAQQVLDDLEHGERVARALSAFNSGDRDWDELNVLVELRRAWATSAPALERQALTRRVDLYRELVSVDG
jgi:hypothetical protein